MVCAPKQDICSLAPRSTHAVQWLCFALKYLPSSSYRQVFLHYNLHRTPQSQDTISLKQQCNADFHETGIVLTRIRSQSILAKPTNLRSKPAAMNTSRAKRSYTMQLHL
eukprot:Blabericola_migrator_1__5097@NODE_2638_length_2501_cov_17_073952_g1655_i0_p1_GENE_NODE_2638_length_2501_cov_17_073952_g1655_i0NODE_2638_length_2501_cov_17_073952_g1655_i0_p1_ORF_typecomplete_len109_score0_73_NODE_2638_length_2501_cov_17_073952_g1655_i0493819